MSVDIDKIFYNEYNLSKKKKCICMIRFEKNKVGL